MTKPEVFIIESLKFDEEADYREGEMIYRSLRMSLKAPIYRYIRTIGELHPTSSRTATIATCIFPVMETTQGSP